MLNYLLNKKLIDFHDSFENLPFRVDMLDK